MLDTEQELLQKEAEAYLAMHQKLLADYAGQWVAVHQGQLLDHDEDENALMERLEQRHPEVLFLVRQVEVEAEREIYVPSFRLAA